MPVDRQEQGQKARARCSDLVLVLCPPLVLSLAGDARRRASKLWLWGPDRPLRGRPGLQRRGREVLARARACGGRAGYAPCSGGRSASERSTAVPLPGRPVARSKRGVAPCDLGPRMRRRGPARSAGLSLGGDGGRQGHLGLQVVRMEGVTQQPLVNLMQELADVDVAPTGRLSGGGPAKAPGSPTRSRRRSVGLGSAGATFGERPASRSRPDPGSESVARRRSRCPPEA